MHTYMDFLKAGQICGSHSAGAGPAVIILQLYLKETKMHCYNHLRKKSKFSVKLVFNYVFRSKNNTVT